MLGNWSLPTTQEYPSGELQLGGGQGSRTWRTFSDPELTQNHFLRKRRLRKRESKREKERERNRVRKRAREGEQESESEREERERDSLSRSLSFFFSVSFPLSLLSHSLSLTFSQNSPLSPIRDRRIAHIPLPCAEMRIRCELMSI